MIDELVYTAVFPPPPSLYSLIPLTSRFIQFSVLCCVEYRILRLSVLLAALPSRTDPLLLSVRGCLDRLFDDTSVPSAVLGGPSLGHPRCGGRRRATVRSTGTRGAPCVAAGVRHVAGLSLSAIAAIAFAICRAFLRHLFYFDSSSNFTWKYDLSVDPATRTDSKTYRSFCPLLVKQDQFDCGS